MPLVLVVDDEEDIRNLIRENLEAAGYTVITAENGTRALEAIEQHTPDAIFLDLVMPEADGFAVLESLKQASRTDLSTIPVFMVTGMDRIEHRIRGGIEGALRYITKPFGPRALVEALAEVLEPGAPPEPLLRRRVQAESLEALARYERTGGEDEDVERAREEPRVRLTRLEHAPNTVPPSPRLRQARDRLGDLTEKQRGLLEALADGAPVTAVAAERSMSRSNVYASLRRIGRKLQIDSTNELLALLRQGALLDPRS